MTGQHQTSRVPQAQRRRRALASALGFAFGASAVAVWAQSLVFAAPPTMSNDTASAKILVRDGIASMRANKNQEAVEKLQQAVSLAPDSPEAQHSLGLVLAKLGKMPEAISAMQKAVSLRPDSDASWLTLGGFYQSNGQMNEALSAYEEFLSRFADHKMKRKVEALRDAIRSEQRDAGIRAAQDRALQDRPTSEQGMVAPLAAEFANANDDYLPQMLTRGVSRWPRERLPITVYIHDGTSVPGYRDSFLKILKQSFEDWSVASDGLVGFKLVGSPAEARLQCFWTNKLEDLGNAAEAGDARVTLDQDGICKAQIWLLTQPISKSVPLSDNFLRLVSLHEIGHGLGLAGHTSNPEDIMFYSATFKDSWRTLSGRDSRSVKRLYKNL